MAQRDELRRCLAEAEAMERSLERMLEEHIGTTPPGGYRDLLARHRESTRRHASAVESERARLAADRGFVGMGAALVGGIAGRALGLARRPLDALPLDALPFGRRHEGTLERARQEASAEALQIATYDLLEALAGRAGEHACAELARAHRADGDRFLAALRELLPTLAGGPVSRQAAQPAPFERAEDSEEPLPGYEEMTAAEIAAQLSELDDETLARVDGFERMHRGRRGVLERVAVEREQRARPRRA